MMTTNIDVSDGLTNGAMGTVTNVVIEQTTRKISVILVAIDSECVEQEARYSSIYTIYKPKCCSNTSKTQATFPLYKKASFQATRSQFPLTLAWAGHNTQMSRTHIVWNCHRYAMCKRQFQTWKSICSLQ